MKFVQIQAVVIFLFLCLSAPIFAQNKDDVVVMKNGDRMTCEIKYLAGGVLYVKLDYVDGTIAVDWAKVARIETDRLFIVKTENGSVYSGKLTTIDAVDAQPVKIEVAKSVDEKVEIDTDDVVTMESTSKRFWHRFNGDINLGVTYSKGNQSTQYNLGTSIQYPRDRWSAQASFNSTLSSNSGSAASRRNQLSLGVNKMMKWNKYFVAGIGGFLQSTEQGIDIQTNFGGGVGRYFKNTNRTKISLIGGFAYQKTKYNDPDFGVTTQNASAVLIATEVKVFRFKKINLDVSATLLPSISEPGRVYFKINESFYIKIFGNLSWNISSYGNWDNRPPFGLPSSDYGMSSGLGWTFGNR